jgi:hypothetical protein
MRSVVLVYWRFSDGPVRFRNAVIVHGGGIEPSRTGFRDITRTALLLLLLLLLAGALFLVLLCAAHDPPELGLR